jgi:formylglycine-generating enzyme required for sulfatase activity
MKKHLFIMFWSLLWACLSWAQTQEPVNSSGKKEGIKQGAAAAQNLQNVLFATNDDCDFFINGEFNGTIQKARFTYLKLAPGTYHYKARSKATLDELNESFTVTDGGTNEVFIDLLLLIDEKNAERLRQRTTDVKITSPLVSVKKPDEFKPTKNDSITIKKIDTITAAINFFLQNMVLVKEGKFVMGNNRSPFPDEAEHTVTLGPFYFNRFEVTQHQWEILMGYNPSFNKDCDYCPVENVSWEEVMKFISKLNAISGRKFRLPTEAEWEYVAKLGGRAEIETAGGPEEFVKKTAWHFQNANNQTHQVGTKEPNVGSIFDMMGNVSEWCSDWYGISFYKEAMAGKNPKGPSVGKEKVYRGGNFKDASGDRFRPSLRKKRAPLEKSGDTGFRLVLDID